MCECLLIIFIILWKVFFAFYRSFKVSYLHLGLIYKPDKDFFFNFKYKKLESIQVNFPLVSLGRSLFVSELVVNCVCLRQLQSIQADFQIHRSHKSTRYKQDSENLHGYDQQQ